MGLTAEQLKAKFPHASAAFIRANTTPTRTLDLLDDGSRPAPELERVAGDGAVGQVQVQAGIGRRFLVRVKSRRKRLLDVDNLAEKYHVDLLRYARIIPSDAPGTAQIEVCQEKVGPKEAESVQIEVFEL